MHEERVSSYKIKTPLDILKEKISNLEKQLFSLMNIKYGEEIIYDDFPIISDNQDYYVTTLIRKRYKGYRQLSSAGRRGNPFYRIDYYRKSFIRKNLS